MREVVRDSLRLTHILEACERLLEYFPSDNIPLLDERSIEFFGAVKNLEIIGEASYKLSKEFIETHTETDWRSMIRMRHIMVHGYYQVSPRIVKEILETEILKLRDQVKEYLDSDAEMD
ncbi:MAG: DUF86 domain-containing protein [Muribaculaceae bacterium]|nr:DUF86 domain-containing protein [Muribaculaceae bacterium]MDE6754731.1 DUF86 domain-containing protein [Muribaculaceae bacterium]